VRLIRVLLDDLDMNFVIFETCCQYFVKKKGRHGEESETGMTLTMLRDCMQQNIMCRQGLSTVKKGCCIKGSVQLSADYTILSSAERNFDVFC
jgi:hypothetical protein